ncbi:hypothetical protein B0H13DRAFT_2342360 [Mycena leptocephala]|nr:hypothetical protein B0H13DRAFT_2342360 [Mycena leptocephala]
MSDAEIAMFVPLRDCPSSTRRVVVLVSSSVLAPIFLILGSASAVFPHALPPSAVTLAAQELSGSDDVEDLTSGIRRFALPSQLAEHPTHYPTHVLGTAHRWMTCTSSATAALRIRVAEERTVTLTNTDTVPHRDWCTCHASAGNSCPLATCALLPLHLH